MAPSNPYRQGIVFLAAVVAGAVLVVLVLFLFDRASAVRTAVLASLVVGLTSLAALVALVFFGRKRARTIARLIDGGYLAHWRYEMGEWERFIAQEHRRNRRILGRATLVLVGALLIIGILYLLPGPRPGTTDIIWLLLLGVALLVAFAYNVVSPSTAARQQGRTDEAYVGALGVYRPDGYIPLRGRMRKLDRVGVLAGDPAALVFVVRMRMLAYPIPYPTWITTEIRVPIPFGREDEAHELAKRFPLAG